MVSFRGGRQDVGDLRCRCIAREDWPRNIRTTMSAMQLALLRKTGMRL